MPQSKVDPDADALRLLPFGAPVAAVILYLLAIPVGQLIWGDGHPSGAVVGAMIGMGLAVILGMVGIAAALKGMATPARRPAMLIAVVLNGCTMAAPVLLASFG